MAARRSARLKSKEEDYKTKQLEYSRKLHTPPKGHSVLDSSSSEDEPPSRSVVESPDGEIDSDDGVLAVTPTSARAPRTNNFLKVYNSYNRDYGYDLYEGEFIDDSDMYKGTPSRPRKRKQRTKRSDVQADSETGSSSDSTFRGQRSKRKHATVQESSDEEKSHNRKGSSKNGQSRVSEEVEDEDENLNEREKSSLDKLFTSGDKEQGNDGNSSDSECSLQGSKVANKSRLDSYLSDSSVEEPKVEKKTGKRRRVQRPESDEEISFVPERKTSTRAEALKREKMLMRDDLLRRLKNNDDSPSNSLEEASPTNAPNENFIEIFKPSSPKQEPEGRDVQLLGEKVLFPAADSEDSSDEGSDWIVSDEDDEIDASVFIDVELMKGVYSSVLMREREPCLEEEEEEEGCVRSDSGKCEACDSVKSERDEVKVDAGDKVECVSGVSCEVGDNVESVGDEAGVSVESVGDEAGVSVESVGDEAGDNVETSVEDLETQLFNALTGENTVNDLTRLLPQAESVINSRLPEGYTAVMLASLRGDTESLKLLLEHGANVSCSDSSHTTPLHLAALCGSVECVDVLIARGHLVDCRDNKGWSPLLYAHFENHHECVLALMKARPQQLSVLSDLLKRAPEEGTEARRRTVKVVRSLLMSLAHHEAYYSLFNSFIGDNPSVLDEDGFGFMSHCMALLSFENKQAWLKGKLSRLREYARATLDGHTYSNWQRVCLTDVPRDRILETVEDHLLELTLTPERCWLQNMYVTFRGEAGICTGPRKEFWSCFSKAVANNDKMFKLTDGGHISFQLCSLFTKYAHTCSTVTPGLSHEHNQLLHLIGTMIAFAVFHEDTIDVNLSKPILKKLVDQPLTHPEDLEDVDQGLYHTLTSCFQQDIIDDLDLTFTTTVVCPWTNQTVDTPIREGGRSIRVTSDNKDDYICSLSEFKLDMCVSEEMSSFLNGFWKVIPRRCLQVFKPNELALLISGVPTISVDDWCKHTQYRGLKETDDTIVWFWHLVHSLKEEEKALLLKFSTGSPRVPAGGFSQLLGLSGPTLFTIMLMPGRDKIPQASTCFNQLKLSDYSCEQELRNKVLIAIRYGCEGFAFS